MGASGGPNECLVRNELRSYDLVTKYPCFEQSMPTIHNGYAAYVFVARLHGDYDGAEQVCFQHQTPVGLYVSSFERRIALPGAFVQSVKKYVD